MTFMGVIIVQYKNDSKSLVMELQLAQLNSAKDMMMLLRLIITKITPGIVAMKPKEGISFLSVQMNTKTGKYSLEFFELCSKKHIGPLIKINWYLAGDLKFLFMMLG